ncbi:unnamed protein product [Cladocopium goreaui]|uniref:Probable RNA-binding protein sce3 n=1 Tax=Cladocopium goreaui TaxID=2562237 RepID=A0A9P1CRK1_9DINO|nr:unnamed protein product [Cladocopium goreaui]
MSGIDKTASDDVRRTGELQDTARQQLNASLEIALQLSGHSLLRRKVKVELWTDDPDAAAAMGAKPLKPYTGPLPEEGPYKVIVRGLDKSVTQRDLGYFFWDRDCECEGVMYPLKNERHAGTVEFKDQESLRKALGLNSAVFKGREITVSIMTKEDNKPEPARRLGSSGGAPGAGGGGKGMGKSRGDDRGMGRREDRGPPSRAEFGSERPRLELKPRSKPMPGDAGYQEDSPPRASGRPDPFGGARYRTTRADADDNWRR